jgi:hypothetical protein
MSRFTLVPFTCLLLGFGGAFIAYQNSKLREQAITLEIWKNCPMPQPGWWLIVESDWVGKKPDEQLRCSFARRSNSITYAPLEPKMLEKPRAY